MILEESLKYNGLSVGEAKVYLATLELGSATVLEIARKTSLKRPTCYLILDDLKRRGLVTVLPKSKKAVFMAESPQQLIEQLNVHQKKLHEVLPVLQALQNRGKGRPGVRFYEGREALERMYVQEIYPTKKIHFFGSSILNFSRAFPGLVDKGLWQFKKNSTFVQEIVSNDNEDVEYTRANQTKNHQIRVLPRGNQFLSDNVIFGNKVAIVSLRSLFMVVIESEEVAETYRTLFQLAWRGTKTIPSLTT